MQQKQRKIQGEQNEAADVSQSKAIGGDPIPFFFTGNIRQIGVIKNNRGAKREIGNNE